jgi:hypothetical protein
LIELKHITDRMGRDISIRRAKIYGKERAMLYDIVTKADVVSVITLTMHQVILKHL